MIGNDTAITIGGMNGHFELNVYVPLIGRNLLESISLLANASRLLAEKTVDGVEANREQAERYAELTLAAATALNPYIGYDRGTEIVQEAARSGRSLREVAREQGVEESVLDEALDYRRMARPRTAESAKRAGVLRSRTKGGEVMNTSLSRLAMPVACAACLGGGQALAAPGNGTIGINVALKTDATSAVLAELGEYGKVKGVIQSIDAVTMQSDESQLPAIRALPYVAAANPDAVRTGLRSTRSRRRTSRTVSTRGTSTRSTSPTSSPAWTACD